LQLKQSPSRRRSSCSCTDRRFTCGRPSATTTALSLLASGGAGRARRGVGAGRRPRVAVLAVTEAGCVYCAWSSSWRARRGVGAGRRPRVAVLAVTEAGCVYCAWSSSWRARLIAAPRDCGLRTCT
jgi:alkylhydroperoxidase family enzyme